MNVLALMSTTSTPSPESTKAGAEAERPKTPFATVLKTKEATPDTPKKDDLESENLNEAGGEHAHRKTVEARKLPAVELKRVPAKAGASALEGAKPTDKERPEKSRRNRSDGEPADSTESRGVFGAGSKTKPALAGRHNGKLVPQAPETVDAAEIRGQPAERAAETGIGAERDPAVIRTAQLSAETETARDGGKTQSKRTAGVGGEGGRRETATGSTGTVRADAFQRARTSAGKSETGPRYNATNPDGDRLGHARSRHGRGLRRTDGPERSAKSGAEPVEKNGFEPIHTVEARSETPESSRSVDIVVNLPRPAGAAPPVPTAASHADALATLSQRLNGELGDQIVRTAEVMLRSQDSGDIRLVLRPPELGRVRIHLEINEGHIAGRILVDNGSVREVVEANLGRLARSLRDQGFQIDQLDVETGGAHGGHEDGHRETGRSDEARQAFHRRRKIEEIAGAVPDVGTAELYPQRRVNLVA